MALRFSTYRADDIDANLRRLQVRPLDVMLTGVTGAGKSSTINAFFQEPIAKVGSGVDPETMEASGYNLNKFFRIWDTPGLGDGVDLDQIHKKKMVDLLCKTYNSNGKIYGFIDMAIIVVEGANRDMGTSYALLNEVIVPNIESYRILVVINQADVAMKSRHWDKGSSEPDSKLKAFLEEQALSIQKRVKEATGVDILKPVCYSAEYDWNVKGVFDFIIDHMPKERRVLKI